MFFTLVIPGLALAQQLGKSPEQDIAPRKAHSAGAKKGPIKAGEAVPMFALKEFGGDFVFLKQYCGKNKKDTAVKAVLLNFFATDCRACVAKFDEFQAMAGKYAPGLKAFLISVDPKPEEKLPAFLKEKKVGLTVLADMYRKTLSSYGFSTVPQAVLIDRECKAAYVMRKEDKGVSAIADHLAALLD